MDFHDFEQAYSVWSLLEAIDWQWPPDVLLRQDDALMSDIIKIASAHSNVRRRHDNPEVW